MAHSIVSKKKILASLCNAIIFKVKNFIKADDIELLDTQSVYVGNKKGKKAADLIRMRDIFFKIKSLNIVIGIEIQMIVDNTILERALIYDGAYRYKQRVNHDDILPCFTFVLYLGEKKWKRRIEQEKMPEGLPFRFPLKEYYIDIYDVKKDFDDIVFDEKDLDDMMKGTKLVYSLESCKNDEEVSAVMKELSEMEPSLEVQQFIIRIINSEELKEELEKMGGEGNMSLGWEMQMQRKLNEGRVEGTHLANYKVVEYVKEDKKCSLNEALKSVNISMESYEAGKKLAKK